MDKEVEAVFTRFEMGIYIYTLICSILLYAEAYFDE